MAKNRNEDGSKLDDSSGSVKEITVEDLKKKDDRGQASRSRVWMSDLMGYPASRNYNQDLYSFAWSQAAQNKPLGFDVRNEVDNDDDENKIEKKEEGELEEGEIEFGSEVVNVEDSMNVESKGENNEVEKDDEVENIDEFENQFGMILEELEFITVEEAESSFEEACSRLQKSFTSLKQMFLQGHGPVLDVLVEQAFVGIQTVYSAFGSEKKKIDQNKELLLRLLIHIKNQYSVFLTAEQVKEIDVRVHTLASEAVSTRKTTSSANDSANIDERSENLVEKLILDQRGSNKASLPDLPNTPRSRVDFSPMLNLHVDYDEDSLPSPTHDNAAPLPLLKLSHPKSTRNVQMENGTLHPYVANAFKTVSSYQQKYGKHSIFESTRLPSPTPSEDENEDDGDLNGEVSYSAVSHNVRTITPSSSVSTSGGFQITPVYSSVGPKIAPVRTIGQVGSEQNPTVKASAKSKDPRLMFVNSEMGVAPQNGFVSESVNSKKHKAVDELVQDEHNLKRQRNDCMSSRDVKIVYQNEATKDRNLTSAEVGYERRVNANFNGLNASSVPSMSTSTAASIVSLPSLLKDIAVNPTMLLQLLKMEQQKIAAGESQQKASGPAVNRLSSSVSSSSENGLNPAVQPQMLPQTKSKSVQNNDMEKIHMKPRDPRRVLMAQKSERSGSESIKTSSSLSSNVYSIKNQLTVREQGYQAQKIAAPSHFASLPEISQQFTQNLQNLADIVSSSQSKISDHPIELKKVPLLCNQTATKSANPWGDVDHLLDGYDDQQKAVIQKERVRRIEEQNKMFAARKLCLVLDLDHTLLNSAKFVEVDPIHEEILRKKEEQDRQKQERHLFRLPHMGMWTKLRPGIWKLLEKASQLFELHVYTMGNKLYATEMAKILDPEGTLFSGRVLSRGDDGDPFDGDDMVPKSKDLDGVLGMESAVVIIDDSLRVWPHNKHNLIVVERYTYFPSSRRQFGLIGPSLLEIDHDERPEDGTLASSLAVIQRIHQIFFSHSCLNEVDVRNILGAERRKILGGCKIVFSRIFPVGEANPHLHPLWQTAEQFGAECTNQIDEQVTHVVAHSLGTDKVNWAVSTGRFVVHPGWVEASALLYRRANEQDFAVKV